MSVLRRNIIAPLLLQISLIGVVSFLFAYLLSIVGQDPIVQLVAGMAIMTVATLILIFVKIHIPISRITQEMKAMLTGKTYRKIMTSKRNEIGILAHFFNEITKNLEHLSGDVKDHQRIKKELNTAQKIQRDLIPTKPPQIPGLDVISKTRSASEIGGDTFNFYVEENRTIIYIGDSTGHGLPAGLVMIMVDTLLSTFIEMFDSTKDMMINLNKFLKPHLQTTMFMTMVLLDWDHKSKMTYVGAGHEYIIHVKASTNEITSTASGGIAVGMIADNTALVKEESITLEENDFIILFTDGIIEAKNIMGEIYGMERLEAVIKAAITPALTSEQLFDKIALDVSRFMEGHMQEDDMTLMILKKTTTQVEAKQDTNWEEATPESPAKSPAPSNVAPPSPPPSPAS